MREIKTIDISLKEIIRGFKKDYFDYMQKLIQKHGSLFTFPFKPHTAIVIMDPTIINHILLTNKDNYIKGADISGTSFNYLKAILGENIFLTDNKIIWDKHRKIILPGLQRINYDNYSTKVVSNCQKMLADWEKQRLASIPINISDSFSKLALQNLLNTLLSENGFDSNALLAFSQQMKFTRQGASFKKLKNVFDNLVFDYVQNRANHPGQKNDMLEAFINAYRDENDRDFAIKSICSELKGFFIAGHETVAASLTWTCYLLSQSQETQQQIKNEFDSVINDRLPTYADLEKVPHTVASFKESLRLYPPIYSISRVALADDVSEDIHIPKGGYIMIPVYHLQRNAKYWQEPDLFKPERFLGEALPQESQQAYIPFGIGQRSCIGREYAMMEACLTIMMIISRYQLTLPADYSLALDAINSLWPKQPLELIINPRK